MIAEPFSPDAFKENVAPRLPVSGGKARSPGLSPLGRKKMRARTDQSRDLPQQPGGVQSKTPKRSLNFGGSSLVRISIISWLHLSWLFGLTIISCSYNYDPNLKYDQEDGIVAGFC